MRFRTSDPTTSKAAAASAAAFAPTHSERICASLETGTMTAAEISRATGLTVVQIDRRLPELHRANKVEVVQLDGEDLVRDGYRVWRLA
jgi:hypothetical protein